MLKRIALLIFSLLFILSSNKLANAKENFETSANSEYKILESGLTLVTTTVEIKNVKSDFYPSRFVLNLSGLKPQNLKAYESGNNLKTTLAEKDSQYSITIYFLDATVGKNNQKTFVLTYELLNLAQKTGEIWEITVPKIGDGSQFISYKAILSVPKSFGDEAYIMPEPEEKKSSSDRNLFYFYKETLEKHPVFAGFGKFQVYNFDLSYSVENTDKISKNSEVALPPDTSTQRVFFENIIPEPADIKLDTDGNWIAYYSLSPGQKLKINVKGTVQIFASPRKLFSQNESYLKSTTLPSTYWQSDDPELKNISKNFKDAESIYNFVIKTLNYNYDRVNPNYTRLGAKAALNNPQNALCMEFTDLFIALARAAGIPAREVNGYAYSQNSRLEPLSLVSDVLHSWPEYWDSKRLTWVPIDPTWAQTTGGADFFNKFDLKHFAFVIHGTNPVKPYSAGSYKLGADPQKDVFVSFGKLLDTRTPVINISYIKLKDLPILSQKIRILINNNGPSASYNNNFQVYLGENKILLKDEEVILPFSNTYTDISIRYGILGANTPEFINVKYGNNQKTIQLNKSEVIINQLLILCILFILALITIQIKNRKIYVFKVFKSNIWKKRA